MRVERFYHSAPSAAESTAKSNRSLTTTVGDFALPAHAFPKSLDAAAYALRKRLICPRWWLIGVMTQWLSKDADQLALQLTLNDGDWVLSGPPVSVKTFPIVVQMWTEIFAKLSSGQVESDFVVELELSRILRGTSSEIVAQRSFVTEYLSSALRVQKVKTTASRPGSRRARSGSSQLPQMVLEAVGHVQVIENVVLKEGTDDTLFVSFSRDPRRLFNEDHEELLPSSLRGAEKSLDDGSVLPNRLEASVVSLQPDVLQALSRAVSPKKLCSYLSIELMKSASQSSMTEFSSPEGVWRGRAMGVKEIAKMHKEHLARAQSFYDHGLLSWENEAPKERVRNLVSRSPRQADAGVVHCWRMSQHAMDAVQFEQALSQIFRAEACQDQQLAGASQVVLGPVSAEIETPSPRVAPSPSAEVVNKRDAMGKGEALVQGTVVAPPMRSSRLVASADVFVQGASSSQSSFVPAVEITPAQPVAQPKSSTRPVSSKVGVWSDDDFLMCVAEFYESLTPLQQQAFERERKRMSPEQFKKYVTPALARLRGR